MKDATQELSELLAQPVTVHVDGEPIELRPIRVRQLPAVIKAIGPFAEQIGSMQTDFDSDMDFAIHLIEHFMEPLSSVIGVLIDRDPEWVMALDIGDFAEIVTHLLAMNSDFFVNRLPNLLNQVTPMIRGAEPSVSTKRSLNGRQAAEATGQPQ